jgi:hypothetical protein
MTSSFLDGRSVAEFCFRHDLMIEAIEDFEDK